MDYKSLSDRLNELEQESSRLSQNSKAIINNAELLTAESLRVADVASHSDETITELEQEFEKITGLTKVDVALLFTALGLQIARQYLVTKFKERKGDQEAAAKYSKEEKHSDRHHRYYNPSLEEIKSNPVPFDALNGSDGVLKGGGKFKHRGTTLGHDPVLGLIFGTANIATATLTTNKLQSFHITTKNKKDAFKNRASTIKIFEKVYEKLTVQGPEGWKKMGLSLILEIKHLLSDVHSKDSLPLPFLTLIDGILETSLASDLAKYGIDMSNLLVVGEQVSLSIFINSIIAMLHRLFYKGTTEEEENLYKVKTRKILMYSNAIAASSNIAVVALTERLDLLDIGGIGVAIYRLITDSKFIYSVKHEFVYGRFHKLIMGETLNLAEINN